MYKSLYSSENSPIFKLIVCDMNWVIIHSALEVFNLKNIFDYSERAYEYGKTNTYDSTKLFIGSCGVLIQ